MESADKQLGWFLVGIFIFLTFVISALTFNSYLSYKRCGLLSCENIQIQHEVIIKRAK